MYRIELSLKTVTPAFIGSADDAHAEWSAKGVRGQLRWWFRALAGGEFGGDLEKVRAAERNIFGSTDSQSPLRVIVGQIPADSARADRVPGKPLDEHEIAALANDPKSAARLALRKGKTNPIAYLGYGPIEYRKEKGNVYARTPIAAGTPLGAILQWPSSVEDVLFERALWCWINLGGVGARSRRGFGSLARDDAGKVAGIDELRQGITGRLGDARKHRIAARWTHFTSEARVYVSAAPAFATWERALEAAGAWMIAFRRRYGVSTDERPNVRGRDYEWLKSKEAPKNVPDRAGFGLPLPFGNVKELVVGWGDNGHEGRRASPLLIHVATFGPQQYHLVLTYIPAQLVPDGATLAFRGKTDGVSEEQKGIVEVFLKGLVERKLIDPIGDAR
jgi:CRISPR-associated protein Cmr1